MRYFLCLLMLAVYVASWECTANTTPEMNLQMAEIAAGDTTTTTEEPTTTTEEPTTTTEEPTTTTEEPTTTTEEPTTTTEEPTTTTEEPTTTTEEPTTTTEEPTTTTEEPTTTTEEPTTTTEEPTTTTEEPTTTTEEPTTLTVATQGSDAVASKHTSSSPGAQGSSATPPATAKTDNLTGALQTAVQSATGSNTLNSLAPKTIQDQVSKAAKSVENKDGSIDIATRFVLAAVVVVGMMAVCVA